MSLEAKPTAIMISAAYVARLKNVLHDAFRIGLSLSHKAMAAMMNASGDQGSACLPADDSASPILLSLCLNKGPPNSAMMSSAITPRAPPNRIGFA